MSDLVGLNVIDDGKNIGIVSEIVKGNSSDYIRINNDFLVPIIPEYIIKVDINNKQIITNNASSLKL